MMILLTQCILALLAPTVLAIPPANFGFPEAPNDTVLAVAFSQRNGSYTRVDPGILFGSQVANVTLGIDLVIALNQTAYTSLRSYNGSYLTIVVDPDASYPETPTSRFILHYLQANQTLQSSEPPRFSQPELDRVLPSVVRLNNNTAPLVPYNPPRPPTNSSAHRYIFYAFQQPANFSVPPAFSGLSGSNRTRFNLTQFIAQANLGTPAAANYFYTSTQPDVPPFFVAPAGSSYPGGNGAAVTSGDPGNTAVPTPTATSSGGAGARATAAGGLIGAGLLGLAALL